MGTESLNRATNAARRPMRSVSVGHFVAGAISVLVLVGITASNCASATAAIRGCYNGRIAFDSVRNGARDIYVIAAPPHSGKPPQHGTPPTPTATPTQITTGLDDARPSWSPPETANECDEGLPQPTRPTIIAFQRTTSDGNTNIYAINAATPEPTGQAAQVTHDAGTDTAPAWDPDEFALGESGSPDSYPPIAFERSINGHHDIFIANFDGSGETNLTNSSGADYTNPSWASGPQTESWLTFDSNQGGVREVWVMQVSRSNNQFVSSTPRAVSAGQPASSDPSWFVFTPEAFNFELFIDTLAFAGPDQEGGPSQIDIADSTTNRLLGAEPFADPNAIEVVALTNDACQNTAPEWSPTGEFIVYQKACAQEKSDIYFLDPTANDASGDINLTEHVGDNQNPDWEAEQYLGVEYFPIRPRGRRSRTRAHSASFDGGGGAEAGGSIGSTNGVTGISTVKPTPVFSAQVKQIIVRGHSRSRVILIVLSINARATVVGELKKGRRQVASHRWHVNGGTAHLRFRVPLRARTGRYQMRVTMRAASGPTLSVARRVRIGS